MTTKEQLAAKLNGREYRDEITGQEVADAKVAGLVVIFGASDDLCELSGAVDDEIGAPSQFTIDRSGRLLPTLDRDDQEVLEKYGVLEAFKSKRAAGITIKARWNGEGDPCWSYETTAPHAAFEIIEDGLIYCRGIVVDLKEAAKP